MRWTSSAAFGFACLGFLSGCATSRNGAAAFDRNVASATETAPVAAGVSSAPAPRATGPVELGTLARELGLRAERAGPGYVLSNADLKARVFPGSSRMTIDGNSVAMGDEARPVGETLFLPPAGVDALRAAVADSARRRMALVRAPAPTAIPVVAMAPRGPAPVVLAPVAHPSARPTSGGDPSWVPGTAERAWKYVVIHHSDDTCGSCAKYDAVHRGKGWENGCGYAFVIGNGSQTGDGEVEVGPRWLRQIQGAHAKTADNRYNELGVGVVLVGDFEHGGRPTARQYESLVRLTRWLMARYDIPADAVLRHSDCKSTACPGRNFPWARFTADVAR